MGCCQTLLGRSSILVPLWKCPQRHTSEVCFTSFQGFSDFPSLWCGSSDTNKAQKVYAFTEARQYYTVSRAYQVIMMSYGDIACSLQRKRQVKKLNILETKEMAQQVRALTALTKNPGLIPSTHIATKNNCNYSSKKIGSPLQASEGTACMW